MENKMDIFFNSLKFMDYVWCFIVGGIICIIAQILIDKTKITSARILVLFVTVGAILRWSWYISVFNRICGSWCNCSNTWIWSKSC